eukprot:COSAG05_NODE_2287_length_3273_cov_132.259609_4_plen_163_part_00
MLVTALLAITAAEAPLHSSYCSCRVSGDAINEHATGVGQTVQLAWQLSHPGRNVTQREFDVEIVAVHGSNLRWHSGLILSAEQRLDTGDLAASNLRLPQGALFRWKVRATVAAGDSAPSTLGCDSTFETGPDPAVFPGSAKWIGGDGQLHATRGLILPAGTC